jgi:hypothetical protein
MSIERENLCIVGRALLLVCLMPATIEGLERVHNTGLQFPGRGRCKEQSGSVH